MGIVACRPSTSHRKLSVGIVVLLLVTLAWGSVQAAEVESPCGPETAEMTIAVGDIVRCEINPAGDSEIFRFWGTAGGVILLTVTDPTINGVFRFPVAQLFTPSLTLFATNALRDVESDQQLTLPETGTYTVLVAEYQTNETEAYGIALQCLLGNSLTTPTTTSATTSPRTTATIPCNFTVGSRGWFKEGAMIFGDLGANAVGGRIQLGAGSFMADDTAVTADDVVIGNRVSVFRVYANNFKQARSAEVRDLVLPLEELPITTEFCPAPRFACGGPAVVVQRDATMGSLEPGKYGKVVLKARSLLMLAPGNYDFCSLKMNPGAKIHVTGNTQSTLNVSVRLDVRERSGLGVNSVTPLPLVNVGGRRIHVGRDATIEAHLSAPKGRVKLERRARLVGNLCADRVVGDKGVYLACADGTTASP